MNLSDFTIRQRLSGTFIIVFVLTLIMGSIVIWQSSYLWKSTQKLYNHPYTVSNAIRDIRTSVYLMNKTVSQIISVQEAGEIIMLAGKIETLEHDIENNFNLIEQRYLGDYSDMKKSRDSYFESKIIRDEVIDLIKQGDQKEAISILMEEGQPKMESLLSNIQILQDFAKNKAEEVYDQARQTHISTNLIMVVAILVFLFMLVVLSYLLNRSINRPMRHLVAVANDVQLGDFKRKVTLVGKDELVSFGAALNRMIESVNERISQERKQRELSTNMINSRDLDEFSKSLVTTMVRFLDAQIGAFYSIDKTRTKYTPVFSIGLDQKNLPIFEADSNEGGIGKSILSGKIESIRMDGAQINLKNRTVLGDIIPDELVSVPIVYKENIYGVLLVAKTGFFNEREFGFLKTIRPVISSAFSNLKRETEVRHLNSDLHQKNQELQSQSEEIVAQSEEMTTLTQELQKRNQQLELIERELIKEKDNLDNTVRIRTKELEKARILAEQSDLLKTAFLANMSHEIRTPMNAILGFSELLLEDDLTEKEKYDYVGIINQNGEHLLHLISDIIEISKIEAGEFPIHPEEFNPKDLLEELRGTYAENAMLKNKDLTLEIHVPDDAKEERLKSDYHRIKQILNNLLNNALKFTDSGSIDFGYYKDSQGGSKDFIFWVKDSGIGIPDDQREKIFDRFVQADQQFNKKYEGTGLGLAICRAIVQNLNGEITLESTVGSGSTFSCRIPSL